MTNKTKDKLLHERLREYLEKCRVTAESPVVYAIHEEANGNDIDIFEECTLLDKWVDEIEQYYIPRPRFEDGQPVQFKESDVSWDVRGDYPSRIAWNVSAISSSGVPIANTLDDIVAFAEMTQDGFVKRRQNDILDIDDVLIKVNDVVYPDILDADNEPIKPGDIVYTKSGLERIVQKTGTEACEIMEDWDGSPWVMFDNGHWMYAKDLSHKMPILDRDGVPIKIGDTVFNVYTDDQYKVLEFAENGYNVYLKPTLDNHHNIYTHRYDLTHQEPDTQEKICKDITNNLLFEKYWGCGSTKDCNNCPAARNGENPAERYKVDSCFNAMVFDLVGRQHTLDLKRMWKYK